MNKRVLTTNLLLLALIIAIGYFTFTTSTAQQRTIAQAEEMQSEIAAISASEKTSQPETQPATQLATQPATGPTVVDVAQDKRFPNFGTRNIFEILIPKPTPTPTPIVTPIPPPPLDQVFANWKLSGVLSNQAMIQDEANQQTIQMQLNGEPVSVNFQAYQFSVTMVRADDDKFEIDLKTDQHGDQVYTLKMFP